MTDSGIESDPSPETPARLRWVLALLVLVFAVYAPSLGNGFAGDDDFRVKALQPDGTLNPITHKLHPLSAYFEFTWKNYPEMYRPVTILSYALTNEMMGGPTADPKWEAFPHHLINVLLKVWAAFLAWQILARVTTRFVPALIGAAVFGLHAIHSEAVAGIVGRGELFAFCFGAQAMILFLLGLRRERMPRILLFAASSLLLFLGFASKETALAWFPFLIVFLIATREQDLRRGTLLAAAVAVPPLAAFLLLRHHAMAQQTVEFSIGYMFNPLAHEETATRVLSAVMIWGYGLFKCLWPFSLAGEYGIVTFRVVESVGDHRFLLAAAALLGWLAAGLLCVRRHPALFAAMACFLGFSFVTSNIPFAIGTIFGERLYFTPSLGFAIAVAWLAGLEKTKRRWLLIPLGAWLLASTAVILLNNYAWQDDGNLVRRDFASNPLSVRRLDQRARQLREENRPEEAEKIWREALALDPLFPFALTEFALFLATLDRFEESEKLLFKALEIPEHRLPMRHVTHLNLSVLYERMGMKDKSLVHLRLAWREDEAYEKTNDTLMGRTRALLSEAEIMQIVATGEEKAPDNPQWALVRGMKAFRADDLQTAEGYFLDAVRKRPRHAPSRFALASVVLERGRTDEARKMLETLRDDPTTPDYIRDQVVNKLK